MRVQPVHPVKLMPQRRPVTLCAPRSA